MWLLLPMLARATPCDALVTEPPPPGPGADLRCADLRGADLAGLDLAGADLSGAALEEADLSGADLTGADLSGAVAVGTSFVGATLAGANLRGTTLRDADLRDAILDGADVCGTDLSQVRNARWTASAVGVIACRTTRLPEEIDRVEALGWRYLPFHRPPRPGLVTLRSIRGLGLFAYADRTGEAPEVDLFEHGGIGVGVSLGSFDLVPPALDWGHRHALSGVGVTLGLGYRSNGADQSVGVVSANLGGFVEALSFLIVEGGGIWGVSLDNDFWSFENDAAWYVGVRFEAGPFVEFTDDLARAVFHGSCRRCPRR